MTDELGRCRSPETSGSGEINEYGQLSVMPASALDLLILWGTSCKGLSLTMKITSEDGYVLLLLHTIFKCE